MLQDEDIDFLYYFGSMTSAMKYQAVRDFTNKPNISIFVRSSDEKKPICPCTVLTHFIPRWPPSSAAGKR